jgi:hypothetical protein
MRQSADAPDQIATEEGDIPSLSTTVLPLRNDQLDRAFQLVRV